METITTVDLLRHGEAVGGPCYRGHVDHALTDRGVAQMWDAIQSLDDEWDTVVSSPLVRCADVARAYCKRRLRPLHLHSGLMEMGFGRWEGMSYQQIASREAKLFSEFVDDPFHTTPSGGEPFLSFNGRVLGAFHDILLRYETQHLVIISHAGVIRVILAYILSMPPTSLLRIAVPHACVSRIRVYRHAGYTYLLEFHGIK